MSDFRHLLCTPCRSIVPYQMLYSHLHNYHKIRSSLCKVIVSQHEGLPVSQTNADVVPLPAGSPPLEFLAPPERGYFCPQCDYTTSSWDVLLLHFRGAPCPRGRKTRNDLSCFVQRWAPVGRKVGGVWRVKDALDTARWGMGNRPCCDQSVLEDPATAALLQMEAEEEARLLQQEREAKSLSNELVHDEKTDWLRGCG